MPPVTIYYHEAATAQADAFRVPGMAKEIILPGSEQPHRKGPPHGGPAHTRHPPAGRLRSPGC